jgi:hypothetical protein
MLTGRAAELRPDINYLHVHPIVLVSPEQARAEAMARPAPAENAETLRARGRMANMRRRTARKTRDSARAAVLAEREIAMIPTSGAARRRAKACRNRDAVEEMTARQAHTAVSDTIRDMRERNGAWTLEKYRAEFGQPPADLLGEILVWCYEHPATFPLDESGSLEMRRDADGSITVIGDIPDVLAISAELLAAASPEYLTFSDGVLAMNVQPETLHYRALGPDPRSRVIVFERIRNGR